MNILNGEQIWEKNGKRHRDGDLPAVVGPFRSIWYQNGKRHRDGDQPAFIGRGVKAWYQHGRLRRSGDQPSVVGKYGVQVWYQDGKPHSMGDVIFLRQQELILRNTRRAYTIYSLHANRDVSGVICNYI